MRPDLDHYFMEIAEVVAKRSTCLHHHVGAVLVRNGQILTTGYNGAPSGIAHCEDIGCARDSVPSGTKHELCQAVHAEQNAIIQAALHGVCTKGSTLYCTHQPCILCAKMSKKPRKSREMQTMRRQNCAHRKINASQWPKRAS